MARRLTAAERSELEARLEQLQMEAKLITAECDPTRCCGCRRRGVSGRPSGPRLDGRPGIDA
jgi:hypothetical protein